MILIAFILYFLISAIIADKLGRNRQIGLNWSLFFCLLATPIVGVIIIYLSKKLTDPPPIRSILKIVIGIFLLILFGMLLMKFLENPHWDFILNIYITLISLGIYLIGIGFGKVYNKLYKGPENHHSILKLLKDITNVKIDDFNKNAKFMRSNFGHTRFKIKWKTQRIGYIAISLISGFLLGWYFKKPNEELLLLLYKADSKWRKDALLDYAKESEPFFFSDYFSFNWSVFIIVFIICLGSLMYLGRNTYWQKLKILLDDFHNKNIS